MNTAEQNMLQTLNILVAHHNEHLLTSHGKTEEEKALVSFDGSDIPDSLGTATFINNLKKLGEKGYTYTNSFINRKTRVDIIKINRNNQIDDVIAEIETRPKEAKIAAKRIKAVLGDGIKLLTPPTHEFDEKAYSEYELSIQQILEAGKKMLSDVSMSTIAKVHILPMRDIKRLLKLMEQGVPFDDVKDPGVWYDPLERELHLGEETVSVKKAKRPHQIFKKLFHNKGERTVFENVPTFDFVEIEKENKRFYESIKDFIDKHISKKHPEYADLFIFTLYDIKINSKYFEEQ